MAPEKKKNFQRLRIASGVLGVSPTVRLHSGIKALDYRADGVGSDDAVLVSTLHNVKGHEFRAVFLLGLNEGILPLASAIEVEDIEREAALLYVAMTRAKELLYWSFSASNIKGKSRFLERLWNEVDVLDFATSPTRADARRQSLSL